MLKLRDREPEPGESKRLFEVGKKAANAYKMTCADGHTLRYTNMKTVSRVFFGYKGGYFCNDCGGSYPMPDGPMYCMHCMICCYDICMKCATKKLAGLYGPMFHPYKLHEEKEEEVIVMD